MFLVPSNGLENTGVKMMLIMTLYTVTFLQVFWICLAAKV